MNSEEVLKFLRELGQDEIISKFNRVSQKEQNDFISQVNRLDKACRGGIKDYLKRAKILLEKSKQNVIIFMTAKLKYLMIFLILTLDLMNFMNLINLVSTK